MYSLLIDTHSEKVNIILYKDGNLIDKFQEVSVNAHSVITVPAIKNIVEANNITVNDLNEIVVVNGPGSFTGERIAVTIGKTMAYSLNIPIKAIDSLSVLAFSLEGEKKYVSIEDRNGAFVGVFDNSNTSIEPFKYLAKTEYANYKIENSVLSEKEIDVNYDGLYELIKVFPVLKAHEVKPLYVKGISALKND